MLRSLTKSLLRSREQNCYCCEYVNQISAESNNNCKNCPLDWGRPSCVFGLFIMWVDEDNYIKAAKLARQIENLPLKPEFAEQYENECREYMGSKVIPDSYKENMMNKFMGVK